MKRTLNISQGEAKVREILESDSRAFLRFLQSLVHSPNDAEELFQAGAVRAIEKVPELKDVTKTRPWLLSIFRNLAFDFLRSSQKQGRAFSDLDEEAFQNIAAEEPDATRLCGCGEKLMDQIPDQYAELLRDIVMEDSPIQAVAKKLKISENNVSVRLHRARNALKKAVQDYCQVETLSQCLNCEC